MSEESEVEAGTSQEEFDAEATARLLELSDAQFKFAKAILQGTTQTKAAQIAGYSGTGSTLRSVASKTMKSPRVAQFLALAKSGGKGLPENPADRRELKRTLSRHLRGADKNSSIRAAEVLARFDREEREAAGDAIPDPLAALDRLSQLGEFGAVTALLLSRTLCVAWKAPCELPPGAIERQTERVKSQLSDSERQRADYITKRQNDFRPVNELGRDTPGEERAREADSTSLPPPPAPVGLKQNGNHSKGRRYAV